MALFRCTACFSETQRWSVACRQCDRTDTLVAVERTLASGNRAPANATVTLADVASAPVARVACGFPALDAILGGGFARGGVYLLAGSPGAGKSTLALQIACRTIARALYVSGEEPLPRLAERAARLNLDARNLRVNTFTETGVIARAIRDERRALVVVDSLQALYVANLKSRPGSPSQLIASAKALVRAARAVDCAVILIGHVTKQNQLSGPRNVEHDVDAMAHFHAMADGARKIFLTKNRFGPTHEIATLRMTETGLV